MPRAAVNLATFNAGEWSPQLYGRTDLARYPNACREMTNFIALAQGPATRRPGTRFVAATKGDGVARLIAFEFSTEQAYVIEAGDRYFRFYREGGRIESPPGTPVEVATPYAAGELDDLKWAQSADVLFLVHPLHQPRKLSRTAHTSWTLAPLETQDGPYLDTNADAAKTLQPSAASGSGVTVTAAGHAPFAASDVGRLIRLKHGATWGHARIVGFTSPTVVTADVKAPFGGTTATQDWRLGAWSATTGWPQAVSFHEERLFFANSAAQPQTFWGSVSGDYESFAPSAAGGQVTADSALTFTIADDRVNAVRWLSSGRALAVGTSGGEFSVQASSLNEALTPDNVTVRRETTIGSGTHAAVRVGGAAVYVQRARRKLFELSYSVEADALVAPELTVFARHLTRGRVRAIAFQQEPWSVLWACRDDGRLIGLTYLPDQEVRGWHAHAIGGTDARVLSLAVIPGDGQDELWLAVERTIGGATRRYVERLEPEFWAAADADKRDAFFVDSGLSYAGAPATTISGLDHLAGESVQVLADGAAHPDRVVSALGQVTLARPASRAQIGLGYRSRLETMEIEAGAADGSAQSKRKRIHEVAVRFWQTLGAWVGFAGGGLEEVPFRDGTMAMDASPALFTGDKVIQAAGGWEREARVVVVQDQPLPCTVLALMPRVTTND